MILELLYLLDWIDPFIFMRGPTSSPVMLCSVKAILSGMKMAPQPPSVSISGAFVVF